MSKNFSATLLIIFILSLLASFKACNADSKVITNASSTERQRFIIECDVQDATHLVECVVVDTCSAEEDSNYSEISKI